MTPHCFEMPNDPRELAAWLERQLTGDTLGELIAELSAAHAADEDQSQKLAEALGDDFSAVLERGLSVASESRLRALIRWPWLLRELQQRVLLDGGKYWQSLPGLPTLETERERVWQRIAAEIDPSTQPSVTQPVEEVAHATRLRPDSAGTHGSRVRHTTWALMPAMLLIAFGLWRAWPRTERWGWNRPGVFANDVRPDDYLRRLADAANEYFTQPRDSAKQLEQTLADFRRSCDVLLAAKHEVLKDADRVWLRERCHAWSKKFDDQLTELRRSGDVATVRTAADETVNKLVTALRTRRSQSTSNQPPGVRPGVFDDFCSTWPVDREPGLARCG